MNVSSRIFLFLSRFIPLLLTSLLLASCASTRTSTASGKVLVGEIYELDGGATVIWCKLHTTASSFWGKESAEECLVPRGTARPEAWQFAVGELTDHVRVKVYDIRIINGIDFVDELVFVQDISSGKKYIIDKRDNVDALLIHPASWQP